MNQNGNEPLQDSTALSVPALLKLFPRKTKRGGVRASDQAAALQRFAFDAAMSLREACTKTETGKLVMDSKTAKAVKDLLSAWDLASDRRRIIEGKGLPASVKAKATKTVQAVQPLPGD